MHQGILQNILYLYNAIELSKWAVNLSKLNTSKNSKVLKIHSHLAYDDKLILKMKNVIWTVGRQIK